MADRYPCGTPTRRSFLSAMAAAVPIIEGYRTVSASEPSPLIHVPGTLAENLGIPGPYPGRVIEVRNKTMSSDPKTKNREAIKQTLARGMKELTGADDDVQAWRRFFEPGDVVGIKVVPNGFPLAPTSPELVLEVIEGLKAAGVKTKDMLFMTGTVASSWAQDTRRFCPATFAGVASRPAAGLRPRSSSLRPRMTLPPVTIAMNLFIWISSTLAMTPRTTATSAHTWARLSPNA